MRLAYDRSKIEHARATARARGHTLPGRVRRVWSGLSWHNRCPACGAYALLCPPVFRAYGVWEYTGPAFTQECTGTRIV
jgi:hypothetical protein